MGDVIDRGPYRTPLAGASPRPATRRVLWALAPLALAVGVFAVRAYHRRPPATSPVPAGDGAAFGAPVRHASRLVGDAHTCALTRLRGGRQQLVCSPVRTVTVRGETREVPRAWPADDVVQLLPASDRRGANDRYGDTVASHHRLTDIVATGLRRDGSWVYFHKDEDRPRVIDLPSAGARGDVVELRYAADIVQWGSCGRSWGPASGWIARTADGSLLWMNGERDPLAWRSLLGVFTRVDAVAVDGFSYCALSRGREVLCGRLPRSVDDEVVAPTAVTTLAAGDVEEVALRAGLVCVRSRGRGVRCRHTYSHNAQDAVDAHARGMQGPAAALALGSHDLCVADARRGWWCAHGPMRDDPPSWWQDASRALDLEPAPALLGAQDVTFADETGCARWPSGAVRCWGRAARGGAVLSRERAMEFTALRGATALDVDRRRPYAIVGGRLRAPRSADRDPASARGTQWFDLPLREPVQRLSLNHSWACAAGRALWCGSIEEAQETAPPTRVDLARAGAQGEVRSFSTRVQAGCVDTDRGEVWCWYSYGPGSVEPARTRALEGGDALVGYGGGVCSIREGHILGCYPAVHWNPLLAPGAPYLPEKDLRGKLPAAVGSLVSAETPDSCVLGTTGRVACPTGSDGYAVVPGVERARSVSGTGEFGCALTDDARVLCWGDNIDGIFTAAAAERAPRLFPLVR